MNVQGRDKDEIPFKSQAGLIGSWFGFGFNALVLCFTFWTSLFPVGGSPNPEDFFMSYLAVPVVLAFYIIHKVIYKPSIIRAKDMDLNTGRREFDIDLLKQEIREEREAMAKITALLILPLLLPYGYTMTLFFCVFVFSDSLDIMF